MFWCRGTRLFGQTIQKTLHSSPAINQGHNPVLQKLLTEFTDVSYVADVVNKDEVRDIEYKEWRNRIALFQQFGFEDSDCFRMISLHPAILRIPQSNLKSTIQQWINAELGMKNFQLILIHQPHLLEVSDAMIRKRLPVLRTYFRGVSALSQMIINCPNVMYDDWRELSLKIDYFIKKRKFKMGDLIKSCALAKDLDFIRLRFYVAEKCGVYKQHNLMPHEENKYKKSNNLNPKLKYILQDNDENFAKFTAKITLEEYFAAKDLFFDENSEHLEEEEDDEDDDDEDDDT